MLACLHTSCLSELPDRSDYGKTSNLLVTRTTKWESADRPVVLMAGANFSLPGVACAALAEHQPKVC